MCVGIYFDFTGRNQAFFHCEKWTSLDVGSRVIYYTAICKQQWFLNPNFSDIINMCIEN